MASAQLSRLLKLPVAERIALAMALWESLGDDEKEAELGLSPEQEREIDRRVEEYLQNPSAAIPWSEVRRKLRRQLNRK